MIGIAPAGFRFVGSWLLSVLWLGSACSGRSLVALPYAITHIREG
jgi:hypothetical protein